MTAGLSSYTRTSVQREIAAAPLDVLIIGGGITGAGILLDAQSRGMRAGLIDMQDFAAGTSNRSTKLVHGGLRYLKQFEIGLVAEVGKERAIVHANARHVTTPIWMLLPVVLHGTYGRFATGLALTVYDVLAGVKRQERHRMLRPEAALQLESLLRRDGLKGAGYYVEYRTDDARLTLEVIKSATQRGAYALNYTRALSLLYDAGRVVGVVAQDVISGEQFEIRARKVVNATGPWVDVLREQDGSKRGKTLRHTKGVHIVVANARFPLQNAVYFDVPDGRMVFAIPRADKTYIGTTDTDYHGDLVHPRMTGADCDYLLQAVNQMFPTAALVRADVESSWVGIRPLISEAGKKPSEVSRKEEVFVSDSGLITIAGGKLTGYRKMAEKVVDLCGENTVGASVTKTLRLSGGDFENASAFERFVQDQTLLGQRLGLSATEAERLARRYGSNVGLLFAALEQGSAAPEVYGLPPVVWAELRYGLEHEMVTSPSDYFVRRTGALYFDVDFVRRYLAGVMAFMRDELHWNAAQVNYYQAETMDRLRDAVEPT